MELGLLRVWSDATASLSIVQTSCHLIETEVLSMAVVYSFCDDIGQLWLITCLEEWVRVLISSKSDGRDRQGYFTLQVLVVLTYAVDLAVDDDSTWDETLCLREG